MQLHRLIGRSGPDSTIVLVTIRKNAKRDVKEGKKRLEQEKVKEIISKNTKKKGKRKEKGTQNTEGKYDTEKEEKRNKGGKKRRKRSWKKRRG
jgi:hypothetical protein